jgi:type IV secretory pathway VirB3-like protein
LQAHAQASAHSVAVGSQNVTTAIRQLAVLLGLAIAIAPTAPLVALYVPQRVARERDRRYLRLLIASGNRTVAVDEALAWRAYSRMPLSRLVTPTSTVLADATPRRVRAVADMELRRLGVKPGSQRDSHRDQPPTQSVDTESQVR